MNQAWKTQDLMENVCFTCTHQELPINFSLKQSQLRILTLGNTSGQIKKFENKTKIVSPWKFYSFRYTYSNNPHYLKPKLKWFKFINNHEWKLGSFKQLILNQKPYIYDNFLYLKCIFLKFLTHTTQDTTIIYKSLQWTDDFFL